MAVLPNAPFVQERSTVRLYPNTNSLQVDNILFLRVKSQLQADSRGRLSVMFYAPASVVV